MATMVDVAAAAGVSPRTVSRVMNGSGYTRVKTRDRVLAAAEKMGYRINPSARALKSGKTQIIGIVVNTISSDTVLKRIEHISKLFSAESYAAMIRFADTPEAEEAAIEASMPWCDGLIIFSNLPSSRSKILEELRLKNFPFILVDPPRESEYPALYIDRRGGYEGATSYLLRKGRTRPLLLIEVFRSEERIRGFKAALKNAGIPFLPEMVLETGKEYSGGREAGPEIIRRIESGRVDAVLCHNDRMALGLLNVLNNRGILVPEDAALIGFDDDSFDPYVVPSLSSIAQTGTDMDHFIFEQLKKCIESGSPIASRVMGTKLMIRRSV
ncbi:LacI family transcriptional regulator [Treponema sp. OttesenSCG-928-L16]|nr:LacI family transcriptional regulator [Treponema sp. OttesenSCG-928-L16]